MGGAHALAAPGTPGTPGAGTVEPVIRLTASSWQAGRRLAVGARHRLGRVREGGGAGVIDLVVVGGLWTAAEVGVRTLPLARVARVFGAELAAGSDAGALVAPEGRASAPALPPLTVAEADRVALAEAFGRRWPSGPGPCLRQALVTAHVLRRLRPRLHLGVARTDAGSLWAHAWVELPDGRAFGRDERVLPF